MSTRAYEFIVGPETSTLPTVSNPTVDEDTVTLGFANETYTPKAHIFGQVADITALKAIASAERFDDQYAFVAGLDVIYHFDAASAATPDDDLVVQPTSGTGRWLKAFTGSGGGSGSGGSGIEQVLQKLELERNGNLTAEIDNSVASSGVTTPAHKYYTGYAIEDIASSDTSIPLVWNPVHLDSSDKNTDSDANWSIIEDAINKTTDAVAKIGSLSLEFDKSNTLLYALLRHANPVSLSIAANHELRYWINLPSTTNLEGTVVRLYDGTANYREWIITTNISGGALATGWNLIRLNASNTSGSTTSGTGYVYTQLLTHIAIGVKTTTGNETQTYTTILIDAPVFSVGNSEKLGLLAHRVTIHDTSNRESVILDSTNDRIDDFVTLAAATTNSYTGGFGASAARFSRSTLDIASGRHGFDSALSSGTIVNTQEARLSRIIHASDSGSLQIVAEASTAQTYIVTAVNASTSVEVSTTVNDVANLLSGAVFEFHNPVYSGGTTLFEYALSRASTGNATYSAPTITIPMTNTTGITVGMQCTKRHISLAQSVVAKGANESFSAVTLDETAVGIKLFSARPFVADSSVFASWQLGGETDARGLANRKAGPSLTKVSSVNLQTEFMNGYFAASGFSGTAWLEATAAETEAISGDNADCTSLTVSAWFKDIAGFTGVARTIIGRFGGGSGYRMILESGANNVNYNIEGVQSFTGAPYTVGQWNNAVFVWEDGVGGLSYLNGVLIDSTSTATSLGDGSTMLQIGTVGSGSEPANSVHIAGVDIFRNYKATQSDVTYLYNGGSYRPMGTGPMQRYYVSINGVTGQKISVEAICSRNTSAVSPNITNIAGLLL